MNVYVTTLDNGNFWDSIDAYNQAIDEVREAEEEAIQEEAERIEAWENEFPLRAMAGIYEDDKQAQIICIFINMLDFVAKAWFECNLTEKDGPRAIDAAVEVFSDLLGSKIPRSRSEYF